MRASLVGIAVVAMLAMTVDVAQSADDHEYDRRGIRGPQISTRSPTALPTAMDVLATSPHVRVLVQLADPRERGGDPSAPANRRAIAELQSSVLAATFADAQARSESSGGRYGLRLMTSLPAFAITVDRAELERLQSDPRVLNVAPTRMFRTQLDQSTTLIGMDDAWKAPYGARGGRFSVAIIDEGVNLRHKFLENTRIIAQACFSGGGNPEISACPNGKTKQIGGRSGRNCPMSYDCDHGTHVAGIAAGFNTDRRPGEPRKGVAYKAKIIAVQVFSLFEDDDGDKGTGAFDEDMLAALDWLYTERDTFASPLAAANMSIGNEVPFNRNCDTDTGSNGPLFKAAIDQLLSANVATVIAAGNEGFRNAVNFPACISSAVTVGASTKKLGDQREQIAFYSNIGRVVDLLAPGGDIFYPEQASFETPILSSVPGNSFEAQQGTSMAAPHVAGAWAAIRSAKGCRKKSVQQILNALKATGTPIRDTYYTKRRVDVPKALDKLGCSGEAGVRVTSSSR